MPGAAGAALSPEELNYLANQLDEVQAQSVQLSKKLYNDVTSTLGGVSKGAWAKQLLGPLLTDLNANTTQINADLAQCSQLCRQTAGTHSANSQNNASSLNKLVSQINLHAHGSV